MRDWQRVSAKDKPLGRRGKVSSYRGGTLARVDSVQEGSPRGMAEKEISTEKDCWMQAGHTREGQRLAQHSEYGNMAV